MIITLLGSEKNLGLIALTDHLLNSLDRNHTAVLGWNYLVQDYSGILEKINVFSKAGKNVLVKFVLPKTRFSNQGISYPEELEKISDVIFLVPSYREELAPQVPMRFLKGQEKPIHQVIKAYYLGTQK